MFRCIELWKIAYIVPDFDENAYSSGLYVIFSIVNGMIGAGP